MDEQPFHEGEEFGFVLLGKIQLRLDDRLYTAKKDECFYFSSDKKHSVKNIGKTDAKILWVVTPPVLLLGSVPFAISALSFGISLCGVALLRLRGIPPPP
jgi:glyoxylate utilization-related uncharacterized protein